MSKKKVVKLRTTMPRKTKAPRRGRPVGSKNKPRDLPADSPYLTPAMYCRDRGISLATFYRNHRDELDIVKFDHLVLITKESARARDQRHIQPGIRRTAEERAAP
jgi:hypothetical protein